MLNTKSHSLSLSLSLPPLSPLHFSGLSGVQSQNFEFRLGCWMSVTPCNNTPLWPISCTRPHPLRNRLLTVHEIGGDLTTYPPPPPQNPIVNWGGGGHFTTELEEHRASVKGLAEFHGHGPVRAEHPTLARGTVHLGRAVEHHAP